MLEQSFVEGQAPLVMLGRSNQPGSSFEQFLLLLARYLKPVYEQGEIALPDVSPKSGVVRGIDENRLPFSSGLWVRESTLGEVRVTRAPRERFALQFRGVRIEPTPDILSFCRRQDILQYLQPAFDLIESSFSSSEELSLQLEEDPDTEEKWVVLDVSVQGEVEKILDEYQSYTSHWVSKVPWPERNKIRLSYNLVD